MSLTTDRNSPCLREILPNGQQKCYLVLSEEERAKGFARPVRNRYLHLACGCSTTMGNALSETYARDPKFYGGTYCCNCGTHFPLRDYRPAARSLDGWAFLWLGELDPVGSNEEEAKAFVANRERLEAERDAGGGI